MSQSIYEIDFTAQLQSLEDFDLLTQISSKLSGLGRVCWLAGGIVRDLWLARKSVDVDLVTDATDEEILQLFPNAVLVGQKFGVYKLPFSKENRNIIFDLTVFREEDNYVDGRRPQTIKRSTPVEDAKRRDFTINALFYDLNEHRVHDYVGGVSDLQNKILKCVGNADKRFNEDHLRLLRLVRFKAQFDFAIPVEDMESAVRNADLISTVSGERVYEELQKVIQSGMSQNFWLQKLTQILWKNLGGGATIETNQIQSLHYAMGIDFTLNELLVLQVVHLANYKMALIDFLKNRLKCSKEEAQLAKKIVELYDFLKTQNSVVDIALWVDSQRQQQIMLKILKFLSCAGQISDASYRDVKELLKKYPVNLISGSDLIGKCEKAQISELLVLARRWQLEEKVKASSEVLIQIAKYLKEKQ